MNELGLNSDLAKEVLTYISFFDEKLLDKLPNAFLKKLNDAAADSEKEYYINIDKTLEEQTMSDECKELLALIYYSFIESSK